MDLTNSLYNIDCLKLIERLPSKSIDLVYLDPPWTTFRLPYKFRTYGDEKETDYFLFLSRRLQHIHRILKETGNLFFHINTENSHQIHLLIDHYFGIENFRSQYILPYLDYSVILYHGKTSESIYNPQIRPYKSEEIEARYPSEDERGRYRLISLITPNDCPSLRFEWNGITPPAGRSWKVSRERLNQLQLENLVSFGISSNIPSKKEYCDEEKGLPIPSIWDDINYFIPQDERTGFVAQQSIELLSRIINIGSEKQGIILDPFCGSGTSLVAANRLDRRWIGCDITPEVYDLALERLIEEEKVSTSAFTRGNWAVLEKVYPKVYTLPDPNFEIIIRIAKDQPPSPQPSSKFWDERTEEEDTVSGESNSQQFIRPLIFTEGKTDWKHIKSAYHRLIVSDYLPKGIDIEFHEDELETGDTELLGMCRHYSKTKQTRKHVFIFDRDNEDVLKKVSDSGKPYKNWGNNVYSFAIPIPSHRANQPKISIEFFYFDEDIKKTDTNGRRLFLSSEFNPDFGRHISEDLNCIEINRLRGEVKIIDNRVFDKGSRNVALTKNDFADLILNGDRNFRELDIQEFAKIFEVIEKILRENR